jgi:hypothetical protein
MPSTGQTRPGHKGAASPSTTTEDREDAVRRIFCKIAWACLASGSLLAFSARAEEIESGPPLALQATIPLKGVAGRIDHMAADLKRNRLIVAELGNNTVDVIDLADGKLVSRITGLHEPQGVGYAERGDLVLVANAGDGAVRMFRGEDLAPVGSISLGGDADNIRIDPRSGLAVVGYGRGGLAIIDPVSRGKIADIHHQAIRRGSRSIQSPEGFSSTCRIKCSSLQLT